MYRPSQFTPILRQIGWRSLLLANQQHLLLPTAANSFSSSSSPPPPSFANNHLIVTNNSHNFRHFQSRAAYSLVDDSRHLMEDEIVKQVLEMESMTARNPTIASILEKKYQHHASSSSSSSAGLDKEATASPMPQAKRMICVKETDSVLDAIRKMSEEKVGAVLVVDDPNNPEPILLGVMTERDYLNKVILRGHQSRNLPVKNIMTRSPTTVTEHSTTFECMIKMTVGRFRHLPVVKTSASREEFPSISPLPGKGGTDGESKKVEKIADEEAQKRSERQQAAEIQTQQLDRGRTNNNNNNNNNNFKSASSVGFEGELNASRERLPPSPEAPRVIGIVSIGDIIRSLLEESRTAIRYMKEYISGTYSVSNVRDPRIVLDVKSGTVAKEADTNPTEPNLRA